MSLDSNVNTNKVDLSIEKKNKNDELSSLRVKQVPTDFVTDQKPTMFHITAGDLRIASVYSGLETKIKLENINVQLNDKSTEHEKLCKLELGSSEDKPDRKDSIVKTEFGEKDCKDLKAETPFPNCSKKICLQGQLEEQVEFIKEEPKASAKGENLNLEMKPEPSVKMENDKEDMEFENEEEFLSGDEFLSDNECGEDNVNAAISNTNGLSSSEYEEDSITSLNENLKELTQFDNSMLGDVIEIYKKYDELWDVEQLKNLHNERKSFYMTNMSSEIRKKLDVTLTAFDLEIILKVIHKQFSKEKKRRLKYELQQKKFTSSLTNFYKCDFLEEHQGPFKCPHCYIIIKEGPEFQQHKSQHDTKECDICGQVSIGKRALKSHKRWKHNVELCICVWCDVLFIDEDSWNRHKNIKHVNKCEKCRKTFPDRKRLNRHISYVHTVNDEKSLQCKFCGKICRNRIAFYYHNRTHTDAGYDCSICKKNYKSKAYLKCHFKNVHENNLP